MEGKNLWILQRCQLNWNTARLRWYVHIVILNQKKVISNRDHFSSVFYTSCGDIQQKCTVERKDAFQKKKWVWVKVFLSSACGRYVVLRDYGVFQNNPGWKDETPMTWKLFMWGLAWMKKAAFFCPCPDNSSSKSTTNRYVCRPAALPYYLTHSDSFFFFFFFL